MKKISPNWWHRAKAGKGFGITTFFGLISVIGFIFKLLVPTLFQLTIPLVIIVIIVIFAVSLFTAYIRGKRKLLPDIFVGEIGSDIQYTCNFCTSISLREGNEMTKLFYRHEFIPSDRAEQWRMKNDKGFVEILNEEGVLCACFGILAIVKDVFDQFVAGRMTEMQFGGDDIYSLAKSRKSESLYISGVVVKDPETHMGKKRAAVMCWSMLMYVKKIYGLKTNRVIYALGVTKDSERLMSKLGFSIECSASNRIDKRNLYKYDLTKESWSAILKEVSDYSSMCRCNFK